MSGPTPAGASCPLVPPRIASYRFRFGGSRFCSAFPSDGSSWFRPYDSLVHHLHQIAQGTFTPKLLQMLSRQDAALAFSDGLRPSLTAATRGARDFSGRGGERRSAEPRNIIKTFTNDFAAIGRHNLQRGIDAVPGSAPRGIVMNGCKQIDPS